MVKTVTGCMSGLMIAVLVLVNGQALAADAKIAVIDMKQVLSTSTAGKRAEGVIKQKMDSLQASLKNDENDLIAMQKEGEKKGAAWSDSVKREKAAAFQKKRQELAEKQENANQELRKLREQQVNPVIKKLEEVVAKVAADSGYAVVLPRNVVLYATDAVDISNTVITELNKVMK
ncbi:MAG: OmpH family outer membrane protein [Desulfobulbus sp.]|uniref:OmpH family outer membrane protein n=1 Tax=Desulfobulbus sp. TaxID=895 RepID=UPI00283C5172|nr:OmpH family outer membrane protein [Desulfobulbus sp.]MDR2551531.1 OmpH family outer membrane protein [Desulfobulbus sp.]